MEAAEEDEQANEIARDEQPKGHALERHVAQRVGRDWRRGGRVAADTRYELDERPAKARADPHEGRYEAARRVAPRVSSVPTTVRYSTVPYDRYCMVCGCLYMGKVTL